MLHSGEVILQTQHFYATLFYVRLDSPICCADPSSPSHAKSFPPILLSARILPQGSAVLEAMLVGFPRDLDINSFL